MELLKFGQAMINLRELLMLMMIRYYIWSLLRQRIKFLLSRSKFKFLNIKLYFRDYSIKLYDFRKMENIYTIGDNIIPQYCESSISVSSDRKYFSVGSNKGQIFVFNLIDGSV
jgi:hypothetical protein